MGVDRHQHDIGVMVSTRTGLDALRVVVAYRPTEADTAGVTHT